MKPHFLQSREWGAFQKAEGFEIFREKGENYEFLAILRPTSLGNYLFVPYGPTLKDKSAIKPALQALQKLAKAHDCIFVRIEPTLRFTEQEMHEDGLKKTHHIEPEDTWILDLTQPDEEIFHGIEKNKARAFRNYAKKGISIRKSHDPADMKIFFKFYTDIASENDFQTFDKKYLENQLKFDFATLYIAELEQENGQKIPIAANILYRDKNTG